MHFARAEVGAPPARAHVTSVPSANERASTMSRSVASKRSRQARAAVELHSRRREGDRDRRRGDSIERDFEGDLDANSRLRTIEARTRRHAWPGDSASIGGDELVLRVDGSSASDEVMALEQARVAANRELDVLAPPRSRCGSLPAMSASSRDVLMHARTGRERDPPRPAQRARRRRPIPSRAARRPGRRLRRPPRRTAFGREPGKRLGGALRGALPRCAVVETKGVEPSTYALRTRRSTN